MIIGLQFNITYAPCEGKYSPQGLKKLARGLKQLRDIPYTASEQIFEAAAHVPKMPIQGVHPKLSKEFNKAPMLINPP